MFTDYTLKFPLCSPQISFSLPLFCCDWGYTCCFQQKRKSQASRRIAHVLQTNTLHILPMLHIYRQALLVVEHMCSSPEVMDNTSVNCADLIVLCG